MIQIPSVRAMCILTRRRISDLQRDKNEFSVNAVALAVFRFSKTVVPPHTKILFEVVLPVTQFGKKPL